MTGFLLDTHILLAVIEEREGMLGKSMADVLRSSALELSVSVVSLWEIAIKVRLGKLRLGPPLSTLQEVLESSGMKLLLIEAQHVLADVDPQPPTRDPFDRLLLAQCAVEGTRLLTLDRALSAHPLAWQPA